MEVQLVTHSIIPNLNSGLVPIDPVGLVTPFFAGRFFRLWHFYPLVPVCRYLRQVSNNPLSNLMILNSFYFKSNNLFSRPVADTCDSVSPWCRSAMVTLHTPYLCHHPPPCCYLWLPPPIGQLISHTGLSLADRDHVTWILASHWLSHYWALVRHSGYRDGCCYDPVLNLSVKVLTEKHLENMQQQKIYDYHK